MTDKTARKAGLVYVSDSEPGWQRRRRGSRFDYVDRRGRRIVNPRELARIRALAIPPAYEDVWICPHRRGHIQATARDARGRKQYRYHADWRARRDEVKFQRSLDFAARLPALRRRVAQDLRERGAVRERVLAAVVRLLDRARLRVGNESYARDNGSYGASTLRTRHVRVRGDRIRLAFRGKSKQAQVLDFEDAALARLIRRCQDLPGQHLFQYLDAGRRKRVSSGDVNAYIRAVMGEDYTAKDFRTWSASVRVAEALFAGDGPVNAAVLQQAVVAAAADLGNTPAVCRRMYVHPALLAATDPALHTLGRKAQARLQRAHAGLSRSERVLLSYLKAVRRRGGA
ncbi:DNA topoisomerase-1 [Tahibacter aquaticus]|uniref:DNA topoisomerase n=1 Tax=Tahibacter aquaticus TaxID=520092 RepID=A0A4R6YYL1_9GAMM|nr:DNA topoisomerase IB [Tahibacter aquaticus]TDR44101.1 DNA topoisomerase-1 [Tahibacter aquaticus]